MQLTCLRGMMCVFAGVLVSMAGCDSGKHAVETGGTLKMELAAEVNGVRYELHNSVFVIEGAVDTMVLAEAPVDTILYELDPGDYQIELQLGWQLYKMNASGSLEPVAANLTSENPASFAIEANAVTPVGFSFEVGNNLIPFGKGSLELGIQVSEDTAPANPEFSAISSGPGHTCGIRSSDGEVLCWPRIESFGATIPPVGVAFDSISAGLDHSCGVRAADGEVQCWGDNTNGQSTPPVGVVFNSVSAGHYYTCGIRSSDGEVQCWGGFSSDIPPTGVAFDSVSVGSRVTCGIRSSDGEAQCWGANNWGADIPPQGVAFIAISTKYYFHTCGIRASDREVQCWGDDFYGESSPPAGVAFESVSAGFEHTCGVRASDGEILCWGDDTYGQSSPPVGVSFSSVSASDGSTCGIRKTDGAVVCWGNNYSK